MPRFNVERMQTNAAWSSPPIAFQIGSPPTALDISTWTLAGAAKGVSATLDLSQSGRLSSSAGDLVISLSAADCAALGPGRVDVEVMRTAPSPRRPIMRFSIANHQGVSS